MTDDTITINGRAFPVVKYRRGIARDVRVDPPAEKPNKRNKYGNKKVAVDGVTIDSRREARRWTELQIMEKAGAIFDLERQPVFILAPSVRIVGESRARPEMRYTADFTYQDAQTGEHVVEDVKSAPTAKAADFRMRQHLMKSVHGIDVRIVK